MTHRGRMVGLSVLVVAAAVVTGWPGLYNDFINFDDPDVVINNPRLQQPGVLDVVGVFTEIRDHAYLPLYYLALMPEASGPGTDPAAFHLASLIWHGLCGVLVLVFVQRLTGRVFLGAATALIYVCHPVAVESVAWVSGRKDQVSLALLLLGLISWTSWLRHGGRGRLAGAATWMFLACFAKGSVVVFPALAALIWLFERGRPDARPARPVIPALALLTALAAVPMAVHLWVASEEGTAGLGATHSASQGPGLFLQALSRYGAHLLVPLRLSVHYHLDPAAPLGFDHLVGAVMLVVMVAALALSLRSRGGVVAFALAWVLVSLGPFNNVFPRTSVPMADRYLAVALPAFAVMSAVLLGRLGARGRVATLSCVCVVLGGLTWERTGEFRDGETVFRRAMEIEPDDPVPPAMVAEALLARSNSGAHRVEAVALMGRSLGLAERFGDPVRVMRARLRFADTQLRSGGFAEAEAQFRKARDDYGAEPDRFRALGLEPSVLDHNLAQSLIGRGLVQDGQALLRQILERDPGHPQSRMSLWGLQLQQGFTDLGRYGDAELRGRARGRINESIEELEELAGELRQGKHGPVREELEPELLKQLGAGILRADWRQQNNLDALGCADTLITRYPDKPQGYSLRASVNEKLLGPDGAREVLLDLTKAHLMDPLDDRVLVRFARQLRAVGQNRKAHRLLERAHERNPASEGVRHGLADLLVSQGRTHHNSGRSEEALVAAEGARALMPDNVEVLLLFGQVSEARGDWDGAAEAYRGILALDDALVEARLGLARFHQARGMGLLSRIDGLLTAHPQAERAERERELRLNVLADYRVALELAAGGSDVRIARRYLREHRARKGDRSKELRLQGERELQAGDMELGINLLRNAVRLDGLDVDAHWLLATALRRRSQDAVEGARRSDRTEALQCVERALSLDPEHLPSLYLASDLYYVKGRWPRLRSVGRRFLALSEERPALTAERKEVERRLTQASRR